MTVAVMVQLVSQESGAVNVTVGGLSLQLCTSSVGVLPLVVPLLPAPTLEWPPLKISAFQVAALPL